jgi:ATP-dependent helicase YprA (DUF1998 family)
MGNPLVLLGLAVAVVVIAAGTPPSVAWLKRTFGRTERSNADRRRTDLKVPVERRKGQRRS